MARIRERVSMRKDGQGLRSMERADGIGALLDFTTPRPRAPRQYKNNINVIIMERQHKEDAEGQRRGQMGLRPHHTEPGAPGQYKDDNLM